MVSLEGREMEFIAGIMSFFLLLLTSTGQRYLGEIGMMGKEKFPPHPLHLE